MIDVVFFTVATVAFSAAALKARGLRKGPSRPGQLALCFLLTTLGLAFVLLSDSAQAIESRIFPNLGRLLSNVCTLLAALGFVSHLLSLSYPPDRARPMIRRKAIGYAVAIAVMAGMFLSSPVPARVGDFGGLYRENPALVIYIDIYVVLFGKAMVDLLFVSVRYARYARRLVLRLGLGTVAVGSMVMLAYLLEKALFVQSQAFGFASPVAGHDAPCPSVVSPLGCLFSVTFPVVAVLLIVVGMTLPTWGPALAAPVRFSKDRRLCRRLGPLWRMLHEAFPQIVMLSTADLGPRWKLQRRVIEIHDGLLALTPYRPLGLREAMNAAAERVGLSGRERVAAVEAALITLALEAYRRGVPAEAHDEPTSLGGGAADLTGEASWLAAIAEAMPAALKLQEQVHV
ncbi:MAB_1171c family putative transporter [Actinocorallia populi]|uniref:MAB_1171c family putative transporter n=1 Tax=Actinocorallia populi TaxID=2079200 RepID=UPI000D097B68|nr:MAB_1171c family putative transporter [Actinocorallia populi]